MNLKELHAKADAMKLAEQTGADPALATMGVTLASLSAKVDSLVVQLAESENKHRIYQRKMEMIIKKMSRGNKILQADLNDISNTQQQSMQDKTKK